MSVAEPIARTLLLAVLHGLVVLSMPIVLIGMINRTRSWWVGRRGPGVLQTLWDLRRLIAKRPVVSRTASAVFMAAPYVVVIATLAALTIVPVLGRFAPVRFDYDFVAVAYTLGLARVVLMIAAMDVGSSFEAMGASREAYFSALAEPALFLVLGSVGVMTGLTSFSDLVGGLHATRAYPLLVVPMVVAFFILLQSEAARVPVDDPQTHLELTMIHEVMILDHSGFELALMQYGAALKLLLYAGLIATLLNPFDPLQSPWLATLASIAVMLGVAVSVGCVESLAARLPMRRVPFYIVLALAAGMVCLVVVAMTGYAT